jgi:hypothetical protein
MYSVSPNKYELIVMDKPFGYDPARHAKGWPTRLLLPDMEWFVALAGEHVRSRAEAYEVILENMRETWNPYTEPAPGLDAEIEPGERYRFTLWAA